MKAILLSAAAVTALATVMAMPVAAQDTRVGVTAVVNPNATGKPPSQERRTLQVGLDIFNRESVITSANGQAQMLFLDQSALTIGPNSEVVLDEYVYDPEQKTGRLALNATKGVFRLVGGQISKVNPVLLKTPTATIGVRGGIAIVTQGENGQAQATFLFGQSMDVSSGGTTEQVTAPGFTVVVPGPNQPPSPPVPASAADLNAALSALEGQSQPASGSNAPTDAAVAESGVSDVGSTNAPSDVAPPSATDVGTPVGIDTAAETSTNQQQTSQQTGVETVSGSGIVTASGLVGRYKHSSSITTGSDDGLSNLDIPFANGTITGGIFSATTGSSTLRFPVPSSAGTLTFSGSGTNSQFGAIAGTSTLFSGAQFLLVEAIESSFPTHRIFAFAGMPTTTFPTTGATFYNLRRDYQLDSDVPFFLQSSTSGLDAIKDGEVQAGIFWDTSGSSTAQRAFLSEGAKITGSQSSQKSVAFLFTGEVKTATGQTFLSSTMRGSSRVAANQLPHIVSGPASTAYGGTMTDTSFFGSNAGFFVLESRSVDSAGIKATSGNGINDVLGVTSTNYRPNTVFSPGTDTLEARTSRNMNGYIGGVLENVTSGGTAGGKRIFWSLGNGSQQPVPTNVEVQTSALANKVHIHFNGEDALGTPGLQVFNFNLGDHDPAFMSMSSTTAGASAFFDNKAFGAIETPGTSNTLDSFAAIGGSGFIAGLGTDENDLITDLGKTACVCSFLNWGVWSQSFTKTNGQREVIHLAGWVSGDLPNQIDIPAMGTATYMGHMYGTVTTPTATYQAAGQIQNAWNFGTRTGSVSITSFDGVNYSGTVTAPVMTPRDFSGNFSGGANIGMLRGSFVKSSTDNVAGQMGDFHIIDNAMSGGNYKAAGIVALQKQ